MLGAFIVSSRRLVTAGLSEWRQRADRSGPGDPRRGSWRLKVNAHSSYVISMQRQSCATRAPIRVRNFMEDDKNQITRREGAQVALNDPDPARGSRNGPKSTKSCVLDPASRCDENS